MSTAVRPPVITHFSAWVACTKVDRRCRDAPAVANLGRTRAKARSTSKRTSDKARMSPKQSRRFSGGLSQHPFQLRLGEFVRLRRYPLMRRHNLIDRAGSRLPTTPASKLMRESRNGRLWNGRLWRILLQKSFWGGERKFLEPLMRFTCGEVRGHIVSSKIDHAPP